MEFQILVETTLQDSQLKEDINKLTERKKSGEELDYGPKINSIDNFIRSELERLENYHPEGAEYKDFSELDKIFKKIVIQFFQISKTQSKSTIQGVILLNRNIFPFRML